MLGVKGKERLGCMEGQNGRDVSREGVGRRLGCMGESQGKRKGLGLVI